MGRDYSRDDFILLNLSVENSNLPDVSNPISMTEYLKNLRSRSQKPLFFGGYLEKRNIYQSELFKENGPIRDIHLGVDVWTEAGTPIFAPIEGNIFSLAYNPLKLDYGYTLILTHNVNGKSFYSLYGHLSSSILELYNTGDRILAGQLLGHLGDEKENGGWSPHVHCQIILDLGNNTKDYPGVCSEQDVNFYKKNCPDPTIFILPSV